MANEYCKECIWICNYNQNDKPCCDCVLSNGKEHIEQRYIVTFTAKPVMPDRIQIIISTDEFTPSQEEIMYEERKEIEARDEMETEYLGGRENES